MSGTRSTEHRNADVGYSLVEMLVTLIVFTLIVGSITTVVITALKHQTSLADRGTVLASTRNSLEQLDRDIRSANPLCSANTGEVIAYEEAGDYIADYKVIGTSAPFKLMYYKYAVVPGSAGSSLCTSSTTVGTLTTYTYRNAAGGPSTTRIVLNNLQSNQIFSIPAPPTGTTFNDCPTGGGDPAAVAGGVANISTLAVNVSVQPPTLSSPVAVSDCGTYLRNYVVH
jgi:Tfp pilus assembly protein PilW